MAETEAKTQIQTHFLAETKIKVAKKKYQIE